MPPSLKTPALPRSKEKQARSIRRCHQTGKGEIVAIWHEGPSLVSMRNTWPGPRAGVTTAAEMHDPKRRPDEPLSAGRLMKFELLSSLSCRKTSIQTCASGAYVFGSARACSDRRASGYGAEKLRISGQEQNGHLAVVMDLCPQGYRPAANADALISSALREHPCSASSKRQFGFVKARYKRLLKTITNWRCYSG